MRKIQIAHYAMYLAWATAFVSVLGSLYFSEILKYPPCILCWYQRIAIYPLVIIIAVGLIRRDSNLHWYVLPFSVIGLFISMYHNLLNYGIIPKSLVPCTFGISCTTKYIEWFGFITIPFLSFLALLTITICAIIYQRNINEYSYDE